MNLLKEKKRVIELMARFVIYVKASTAMTETDINKASETILIPLFEEIYGYKNLKNINDIEDNQNYPAIDLGDKVARVAIQVTATKTLDKVKHTLKEFIKHEFYKDYDKLIVYVLTEKQANYSDTAITNIVGQNLAFDVEKDILDYRDLSAKINTFDIEKVSKIKNILEAHFGSLSPFLSSEDFFHSQLDSDYLFNHTWKLEGRSSIIDSLREFVKSENKKVAILPGRGGIGKSKLMYEFGKEFNFSSNFKLWFVEEGVDISSENVNNLPLEPCVIVLDDAHQQDKEKIFKVLLTLVRNRAIRRQPEIKLLLSSRPHGIQYIGTTLNQGRIDSLQIQRLDELQKLSTDEMKALARQVLNPEYANLTHQLAAIADDSPLVLVVGGQLLNEKGISLNLLERETDFQFAVFNRFQDILLGQISQQIEPIICKKILELISATAPFNLKNELLKKTTIEFLNIEETELIQNLGILEKGGILVRRGNTLKITPDALSDHILYKACLTEQEDSTGYAEKIFEKFRQISPEQVLSNLAELDWRVRLHNQKEVNLIKSILYNFQEEFKKASNLDRYYLLDILEKIAYYQPEFSLNIVQFAIRNPANTPENEGISVYRMTHLDILSKIPKILKDISYTVNYLPICCDLLWQLGRDDSSDTSNNPPEAISILIDLAKYSIHKNLNFNWQVLKKIEQWLQKTDAHDHLYSPLDILNVFLYKEIHHSEFEDNMSKTIHAFVNHEITRDIRDKALNLISTLLDSANIIVILKSLKIIASGLSELQDRSGNLLEIENQWWEPERLQILDIISEFVTRDIEPIIQLKAIELLSWSARWSHSEVVKHKAQNIILNIPKTDHLKLTAILSGHHKWHWNDKILDLRWQEYDLYSRQITDKIVSKFLEKYPSPKNGIEIINERLDTIVNANGHSLSRFFEALSRLKPEYSITMCEQILEQGDCLLAPYIDSILYQARVFDLERAVQIVHNAVDSNISSLCEPFARTYWAWDKDIPLDQLEALIHKLLAHSELKVKKATK